MTWVRLDDAIGENPKLAPLSGDAFALYVCGLAYCNRNLTDGFIPNLVGLGQLRYCDGNAVPAIRELESGDLWEAVQGGWQVHDYDQYQPSRAKVEEERSKKQAAGQAGGQASAKARAQAKAQALAQAEGQAESNPVPVPVPNPQSSTSSSNSGKPGDEAKALTNHLKARLKARGVTSFERDWHLKGNAVAQDMLRTTDYETIYGCIEWALEHHFFAAKTTTMLAVRDRLPEFQQLSAGVVGKPDTSRQGPLDRIAGRIREVERGRSRGSELGGVAGRGLPG